MVRNNKIRAELKMRDGDFVGDELRDDTTREDTESKPVSKAQSKRTSPIKLRNHFTTANNDMFGDNGWELV